MPNAPGSSSRSGRFLALLLACVAVLAIALAACRAPVDATAPTLELAGIADGAVVPHPDVVIEVVARDDRAVASVRYETDHGDAGPCRGASGASFLCGPISLPSGPTLLTFQAVDASGNVASTAIRLHRPRADTTPPDLAWAGVAGEVTLTAETSSFTVAAWDAGGIESVRYATDHGASGACTNREGDAYACGPVPLPLGDTTLTVTATDVVGNAAAISLTIHRVEAPEPPPDTTPPSLVVSGLQDGDVVTDGQVELTAASFDDRSVPSVDYATDHGAAGPCVRVGFEHYQCGPIPLPLGETTITITARDDAGNAASIDLRVRRDGAPSEPGFDIEIVYFDETFSASQRAAFATAVDRWETLVVGDLEDVTVDLAAGASCGLGEPAYAGTIDDLVIFATSFTEGVGGLLGSAGPCRYRSSGTDAGTMLVGVMRFDTMDLANLEATGNLVDVIVHEMAHVLGFGTVWEFPPYFDLLDYQPSDLASSCRDASGFLRDPTYVGAGGMAAFFDLGGNGAVPVEEAGGPGTQCGHWDEDVFGNELMTGYLNLGGVNPLSALSVRSLQDIGLTVDASQADPYTLPSFPALRTEDAFDLTAAEELLRPRGGIDPATGRIERRDDAAP